MAASSPGSKPGGLPPRRPSMRAASMSATVTRWPSFANPTAVTSPTWPAPTRKRCIGAPAGWGSAGMVPGLGVRDDQPLARLDEVRVGDPVGPHDGLHRHPVAVRDLGQVLLPVHGVEPPCGAWAGAVH